MEFTDKKKMSLEDLHNYMSPLLDLTGTLFHWREAPVKAKWEDQTFAIYFTHCYFYIRTDLKYYKIKFRSTFLNFSLLCISSSDEQITGKRTFFVFVFWCLLNKTCFFNSCVWGTACLFPENLRLTLNRPWMFI